MSIASFVRCSVPLLIGSLAASEMGDPYSQGLAVGAGLLGSAALFIAGRVPDRLRKLIYAGVLVGGALAAGRIASQFNQIKEPPKPLDPFLYCSSSQTANYDYSHFRYRTETAASQEPEAAMSLPCEETIAEAKTLLRCYEFKSLWDNTQKNYPFELACGPYTQSLFKAGKTTLILGPEPRSAQQKLLFETVNIARQQELEAIDANPCARSPEAFAESIESYEYGTATDVYVTASYCKEEGRWRGALPRLPEKSVFLKLHEKAGHTFLYIAEWFKKCDPRRLVCPRVYQSFS